MDIAMKLPFTMDFVQWVGVATQALVHVCVHEITCLECSDRQLLTMTMQ